MRHPVLPPGVALVLALTSAGCHPAVADRDVHQALVEVQANLAMSHALEQALDAPGALPCPDVAWEDVRTFYQRRDLQPVWVTRSGPTLRAAAAIGVLRQAPAHGFSAADYGVADLVTRYDALAAPAEADAAERTPALVAFDTRLTAAMLALGHDVALGRTDPRLVDPSWRARRAPIDLPARLSAVVDRDTAAWLEDVQPRHPEYAALSRRLAGLAPGDEAATVALNLERWRWMPDDLGARYLLINIPQYRLFAREDGRTVLESRVIVGKRNNKTPILSSAITTVVLSPYWHIPDTIAAGETVPAILRDPTYLARNEIDVLRVTSGRMVAVDPTTVNWDDPAATRDLAFRQRPGAANALGHVKFLLPNPYSVYLHDTPADELFARAGRALSHGCVRVERAEALAKYLLRGDPAWDEARIDEAMRDGVEQSVPLATPMPVHLVYFTASVTPDGQLEIWPDVYGDDRRQRAIGRR